VFDLDAKLALALRGDYMDDRDGVRTSGVLGFPTAPGCKIGSGTLTLNVKSWPHALVRPEMRVEHSNHDDFGNPGDLSPTQVTLGIAFSYIF
jgi:putative OmpL-like beta-barrel porin-2